MYRVFSRSVKNQFFLSLANIVMLQQEREKTAVYQSLLMCSRKLISSSRLMMQSISVQELRLHSLPEALCIVIYLLSMQNRTTSKPVTCGIIQKLEYELTKRNFNFYIQFFIRT